MAVINLLKSIKSLFNDALGVLLSRQKQKQLLGISLYRNALFLVITNLAVPLTSFVFWIIVARFYTDEDVGLASAALSMVTLLALFSTLGFEFGLIRYLSNSGQNANRMVNTSFTIGTLASVVCSCIFLAGINIWSPSLLPLRNNSLYLAIFILFTVTTTVTVLLQNAFVAQRRANYSMAISLIANSLKLPLPVLFILYAHSFGGIIFSLVTAAIVALIVGLLFYMPRALPGFRLFPTINRSVVSQMISFSTANFVANVLWSFTIYVLPIMVVNVLGAADNAYFFIAWTIGGVLGTISLATNTSLFAEGSFDERKFLTDVWRCIKMTFIILIPAATVVFAFADKLLLLYGTAYSTEGTMLLRVMAVGSLPLSLNGIYISILRVKKKTRLLILLTLFVAIVTLAVSYLLLPHISITAPGVGWLVSNGIVSIFVVTNLLKTRRSGQF